MKSAHLKRDGAIWAGVLVVGLGLGLVPSLLRSQVVAQTRGVQAPLF